MYDSILLPTDGSDEMEQVLAHARDLAQRYDARLHLLYVLDTRVYLPVPDESEQTMKQAMTHEGKQAVQALAQNLGEDIELVADLAEGVPHKAIGQYALDRDIDLIVMGTNGRTGAERQALGSVAERTVQVAPVPVHIVPLTPEDDETEDIRGFQ